MDHPPYTCLGDRVLFTPAEANGKVQLVAFVVAVRDPHRADLVYWCRKDLAWKEATSVPFMPDGDYGQAHFVNPEA